MFNGMGRQMMLLRMESKARENQAKPAFHSPELVQTGDYVFSRPFHHEGDSGELLLAKQKSDRRVQYLVKHAMSDCACNEFVYTKLAQAMGYTMPDVVLFVISPGEKRRYFQTEYIIGERYLHVVDPAPSYDKVRACAKNREQYFPFYGLYALTGEGDGLELLLADDGLIYRVDTTDAFPLGSFQLDLAGIDREFGGYNPQAAVRE